MQRQLYPENWNARVLAADLRAGGRCEGCGAVLGTLRVSHKHNLYFLPLHTCHINHDPENPQAELRKLCPSCHGKTHPWLYGKRAGRRGHRYGYQSVTVTQLIEATRAAGLHLEPVEDGYRWACDDLTGHGVDVLDAVSQALHWLLMERLERRQEAQA